MTGEVDARSLIDNQLAKRISYIDNLRGLCLVLMVLGHTGLTLVTKNVIYSFHMPIFFILSGMLYHGTGDSVSRYLGRKALRLWVPYLLYTFIVFGLGQAGITTKLNSSELFRVLIHGYGIKGGGGALWFLVSLFWTYVFAVLRHKLHIPSWLMLILSFAAWWVIMEYKFEPWLGINMAGPFFFTLGEMMPRTLDKTFNWCKHMRIVAIAVTVVLLDLYVAAMLLAGYPNGAVINIAFMSHNIASLLASVVACFGLILLFRALPDWKRVSWLGGYLSNHAIVIIGTHLIPIVVMKKMHIATTMSHDAYIWLVMLVELVWLALMTIIIPRILPILDGKSYRN